MNELVFVLSDEQVDMLGLDPGTWWGVLLMNEDDDERKTNVTADEEVRDVLLGIVEDGVLPPPELESWAASQTLEIPGWPSDW